MTRSSDPPSRIVPTPAGDARVTVHVAGEPRAVLVAGHGAGGGANGGAASRDLVALAAALPARGVTVVVAEQPWRVAGRALAPAPGTLDAGWLPVVADVRAREGAGLPLFAAGRSAGARVACRTAVRTGAAGVVALAFPLHPPGRPEKSRAGELLGAGVPVLVVQGEADTFGGPGEFPPLPDGFTLTAVPSANHGFQVPKRAPIGQQEALDALAAAAGDWVLEQAATASATGE